MEINYKLRSYNQYSYAAKCFVMLLLILLCPVSYANRITLQDLAGRTVEISQPVERLFLANSNYLQVVDLVSGDSHFNNIVGWDDTIKQFFPDLTESYFSRYPELKNIPVIGKNSANINAEAIIKLKPDVVIASLRRYEDFKSKGMIKQLQSSGIEVIFVDFRSKPIENTIKSITLFGELLNSKDRAKAFTDWYSKKFSFIEDTIRQTDDRPRVLYERNAGVMGKDGYCCNYFGSGSDGKFVALAGGNNLLAGIVPPAGGEASLETVLTMNPQYYILSGADWSRYDKHSQSVPLGYHADKQKVLSSLQILANRRGISMLDAIKSHQIIAIYAGFSYDTPLNILTIEAMAKFLHPELFQELDPDADLNYLHEHFMSIPATGVFWQTL